MHSRGAALQPATTRDVSDFSRARKMRPMGPHQCHWNITPAAAKISLRARFCTSLWSKSRRIAHCRYTRGEKKVKGSKIRERYIKMHFSTILPRRINIFASHTVKRNINLSHFSGERHVANLKIIKLVTIPRIFLHVYCITRKVIRGLSDIWWNKYIFLSL